MDENTQVKQAEKYCPRCGHSIPIESRRCTNCGAEQPDFEIMRLREELSRQSSIKPSRKSEKKKVKRAVIKTVLIMFLIMVAVVGLLTYWFYSILPEDAQRTFVAKIDPRIEKTTDLTGTWQSENENGSYMEAIITDQTITVNWVTDDTSALYWSGSYTAPEEAVSEYTWTSQSDLSENDIALLASPDKTKDFTYSNNEISFQASMAGITKTMKLNRI